jgi:hypothetical protein
MRDSDLLGRLRSNDPFLAIWLVRPERGQAVPVAPGGQAPSSLPPRIGDRQRRLLMLAPAKPLLGPLAIHQLVQAIVLRRPPRIGVRVDHQVQ